MLPSKSYLKFKGQTRCADNDAAYATEAKLTLKITLINKALMFYLWALSMNLTQKHSRV